MLYYKIVIQLIDHFFDSAQLNNYLAMKIFKKKGDYAKHSHLLFVYNEF